MHDTLASLTTFATKHPLMMSALAILSVFAALPGGSACFAAEGTGKKILVAYFSHSGNTREIATQIHERVGGDIFEIRAVHSYPSEYSECVDVAKREQQNDERPELAAEVADMASYDVVFLGYPNWWGTMPMPCFTFLGKYDLSGKTVVPFCTHEGSRLGRSVRDITRLCPKATVLEGLAVRGSSVKSAQDDVAGWLRKLGMIR